MPMFGHKFYHGALRRYVILFGNLFNEITVDRFDQNGNKIQVLNVPIEYGPKQKFIQRITNDPDFTRPVSTILPRLGFEFTTLSYAPNRKLNSGHAFQKNTNVGGNSFNSVYTPVPYDMNFTLHAFVRNIEDGTQIVEQIVPFFTPDWTVTMKAVPELGVNLDIPVQLNSISSEDSYEGDFDTRRIITWQLDFTVKGYLFGPIQKKKYINSVDISLINDSEPVNKAIVSLQSFNGDASFNYSNTITDSPRWTEK